MANAAQFCALYIARHVMGSCTRRCHEAVSEKFTEWMIGIASQTAAEKTVGQRGEHLRLVWRARSVPEILDTLAASTGDLPQRGSDFGLVQHTMREMPQAFNRRAKVRRAEADQHAC